MRRVQWVMFVLSALVAGTVILEAQLWVSTPTGVSTTGTITSSNPGAGAVAVAGGGGFGGNLDIGGTIQAGSGNVTLTNSTGNLLETAIADGSVYTRNAGNETVTGTWVFDASSGVSPIVVGDSAAATLRLRGRSGDNIGTIFFFNNAGNAIYGSIQTAPTTITIAEATSTGFVQFASGSTRLGGVVTADNRYNSAGQQPGFLAYLNANTNLTIAGLNTVPIATEVYDTGGVFNSNTFTAPVAGVYNVCASIESATSTGLATFQMTTSVGLDLILGSVGTATAPPVMLHSCSPLSLSGGETVAIQTTVAGGQTISVFGSAGLRSWFSARLVP